MRTVLAILAITFVARPAPGRAEEEPSEVAARIETDDGTIEIIQPHHGRVIETPEGYLRIEEGPDLDEGVQGSFGTYHATPVEPAAVSRIAVTSVEPPPAPVTVGPDGLVDTSAPTAGADPCHAQRERYFRRLLQMSGVYVDRPLELLDGLAGPGRVGANVLVTGYLSPGVDPLKPLAWDQELRSLGRDLAVCQTRVATARP
jgi:hypothetical protein